MPPTPEPATVPPPVAPFPPLLSTAVLVEPPAVLDEPPAVVAVEPPPADAALLPLLPQPTQASIEKTPSAANGVTSREILICFPLLYLISARLFVFPESLRLVPPCRIDIHLDRDEEPKGSAAGPRQDSNHKPTCVCSGGAATNPEVGLSVRALADAVGAVAAREDAAAGGAEAERAAAHAAVVPLAGG